MAKTDREELFNLICQVQDEGVDYTDCLMEIDRPTYIDNETLVKYLIDNGVTVRNNEGCDYCQKDRDGCRTMFGAFSISNPLHGDEWFINTGHCKPRQIFYCPMCGKKLERKQR